MNHNVLALTHTCSALASIWAPFSPMSLHMRFTSKICGATCRGQRLTYSAAQISEANKRPEWSIEEARQWRKNLEKGGNTSKRVTRCWQPASVIRLYRKSNASKHCDSAIDATISGRSASPIRSSEIARLSPHSFRYRDGCIRLRSTIIIKWKLLHHKRNCCSTTRFQQKTQTAESKRKATVQLRKLRKSSIKHALHAAQL